MEAKRNRNAKLVVRRSALQPDGGRRRSLRADPRRHRHRLPRRPHQLRADAEPVPRRVRPAVHQRVVSRLRAATRSTRRPASSRVGTASGRPTPTSRAGATSSTSAASPRSIPTLEHPRSVFQVMKRFYARYTPEMVASICGCSPEDFLGGGRAHHLHLHGRSRRARSCTRSGGRITATRCSSFTRRRCCSCCSATSAGPAAASTRCAATPTSRAAPTAAMAYHNLPGYIPVPKADHADARRVSEGGHAESRSGPSRRTSGRTPIASWSASSRRTTASAATSAERLRLRPASEAAADRRRAATRTGAGRTSSIACTAATWKGSSASA